MTIRDPSSQPPFPIWLHVKTQGLYEVLHHGIEEGTLKPVVIYRRISDGSIWTRPCEQFYDGRFTQQP